jgi:LmbE family N-acetylglucosaminyl deacetylase
MLTSLVHPPHVPDGSDFTHALARTTHLAIGAHQDDLEIFAYHGIAVCYGSDDAWFGGVTVTDGGGSARIGPYANYSDEQMKEVRFVEQNAAADIGQYSFQLQLGFPSHVVKDVQAATPLVLQLVELFKSCRPHTLYLHNPADKHPSHIAVLQHCITALRQLPADYIPAHIYGCEVWRGLDWLRDADKVALPVPQPCELARQLLDVFASQVEGGKNYTDATLGRRAANATYFASHHVDSSEALTFAMDLRPLVDEPGLTPLALVQRHLECFRADVEAAWKPFVD